MKSFHHAAGEESLHLLVEQDAAIDDYLAGLLKDLGETTMTAAHSAVAPYIRNNNPVGLSIVTRSSVDDVERLDDFDAAGPHESWSTDRFVDVGAESLNLDLPEFSEEEMTDLPSLDVVPQSLVSVTEPVSNDLEVSEVAGRESVATMPVVVADEEYESPVQDMPSELAASALEPPPPEILAAVKPWRIFAIGGVKVGLPLSEIKEILISPTIEPLKGAPAHVAGTVLHQGRRRMVLSLAHWFPGAVVTTPQIILLGADGLWGVEVGPELAELVWDESLTQWRSDDERAGTRPWLAGVNRAAGVAFLTVPALRAALKSSR